MMIAYSIRVTGRVQGVGFRYYSRKAAEDLKIRGTVRNLPDGSVLIEAEGEEENLRLFAEWCRKGPVHAFVSAVEMLQCGIQNFPDFQIIG